MINIYIYKVVFDCILPIYCMILYFGFNQVFVRYCGFPREDI